MKRFIGVIILLICAVNVCACAQKETLAEESVTKEIPEYAAYSGTWTSNGYDENSIYTQEGGAILSIHIENNHLEGTYVYVQENSYRIASVEDIDAEIIDSVAEFDFSDDGWGNSGKLTIALGEQVSVNVDEIITDPDNTTGMTISPAVLDRENSAETDTDENEYVSL
jgi:hypothetical protein